MRCAAQARAPGEFYGNAREFLQLDEYKVRAFENICRGHGQTGPSARGRAWRGNLSQPLRSLTAGTPLRGLVTELRGPLVTELRAPRRSSRAGSPPWTRGRP